MTRFRRCASQLATITLLLPALASSLAAAQPRTMSAPQPQHAPVFAFDGPVQTPLAHAKGPMMVQKPALKLPPFLSPPAKQALMASVNLPGNAGAPPLQIGFGDALNSPIVTVFTTAADILQTGNGGNSHNSAMLKGEPFSYVELELYFNANNPNIPMPHAVILDCSVTDAGTPVVVTAEVHAGTPYGNQPSDLPLLGTLQTPLPGNSAPVSVAGILQPTPKQSSATVVLKGNGNWWYNGCQLTPVN